jgi:hypothetical protein
MSQSVSPDDISLSRCELLARLNVARKRLGWSLERLANKTAGSDTSWDYWLKGTREIGEYVVKLAVKEMIAGLEAKKRAVRDDASALRELQELQESLRLVPELWNRVQKEQAGDPAVGPPQPAESVLQSNGPESAADYLAAEVERQWTSEANKRRLFPVPIPLRWRWARGVTTKAEIAANDPPRRSPSFAPLPGVASVKTTSLQAGAVSDLFDVYGGLDSGRLVILSEYGRGKSGSAILTLLEALKHRARLGQANRAAVPVPVLLTTHGWDPANQDLDEWLAARLNENYPFLRSRRFGRNAAARLVEDGGVALFLDGLDEIAAHLRQDALARIGLQTRFRLIVFTRSTEFADAVAAGRHIAAAAALELLPVSPDDAAAYLENCQLDTDSPHWERVTTHLREQPDSALTRALDSPLNLALLRDVGSPATIDELLTSAESQSRDELEGKLLGRFADVVYENAVGRPAGPSAGEAKLILGFFATKMNQQDTRDLAWWQMHRWSSPAFRVLITSVLGIAIGALVGVLAFGPGRYTVRGASGALFGLVYFSALGLGFGFLSGLASELKGSRAVSGNRWRLLRPDRFNPVIGLVAGLLTGLAVGNQSRYVFGLLSGLLVAAVAGRAATQVGSGHGNYQSWWASVRTRFEPVTGVLTGLSVGLAYGLTKGMVHGLAAGVSSMFALGLMVGFSKPSSDAVIDPYSSWRQDRRRSISFGLTAGLTLGLPLAIKNGIAHGFVPGVLAGVGFATIIGLGCALGISDAWRTTVLFFQLRRQGIPIHGIGFLENARDRGVLRTVGPLYQFMHPSLRPPEVGWGRVFSVDQGWVMV